MEVLNYKDDPRAVLIHFNPNHDPRNGQFSSKKGSGRIVVKDRWFDSTKTENPSPNSTSNDMATSSKPGKIYSKYQNADGSLNERGLARLELEKKRKGKNKDPNDPGRWEIDDTANKKELVDATGNLVRTLSDIETKNRPKPKKYDLSSMTDADLQAQVRRMQLEQQYSDMMNRDSTSKGRAVVQKILSFGGGALAVTSSVLGIALAIKKLKE